VAMRREVGMGFYQFYHINEDNLTCLYEGAIIRLS